MKNVFKVIGIIALVAVIGFSMAACDDGSDSTTTTTYPVTVNGGSGSGSYAPGATVSISATASSGQTFTSWTVNSGGATLENANTASTTFTMPANAVIVTANFTDGGDNDNTTNPDVGTGDFSSRMYKVEVYRHNSTTWTYLRNTYSKNFQDIVRDDVISKGGTLLNSYTNQTFEQVKERYTSAANAIGYPYITDQINSLTVVLQTNNRNGHFLGFAETSSSTFRFFYVNRTSTNPNTYTVEVYRHNSATWTYLKNTYGGKTIYDVVRADVISRDGTTLLNSYTNQTFEQVKERYTSAANAIGYPYITDQINSLTNALQTNNRSGYFFGFADTSSSNYRFFYVKQEK